MYTEQNNQGIFIERQVRIPSFTMSYEHFHAYYEIFYLKSGCCIYSVNNCLYHLNAGDIFIVAPGDSHLTRYEGEVACERTVVYYMSEFLSHSYWESHPEICEKLSKSGKVILTKMEHLQMEALLDNMLEENNIPDEYSYEFLQLQLMTLLLTIQRNGIFVYEQLQHSTGISIDIESALRYIARNFDMPITLEEVASEINLTPTYLSRKFKKVTGTTFREYVTAIRIRRASQLLLTTDDSITKIALDCGFNSSNYFKDCFRRLNGVSPRTFRKQAKQYSFEFDTQSTIDPT